MIEPHFNLPYFCNHCDGRYNTNHYMVTDDKNVQTHKAGIAYGWFGILLAKEEMLNEFYNAVNRWWGDVGYKSDAMPWDLWKVFKDAETLLAKEKELEEGKPND